jgi:peptide/nickel transport system substrate-binding protein
MAMNTTQPPFDRKEVRQAINYAVDRQRFVNTVLQGNGEPRALPWATQSPSFDAAKNRHFTFDPEKAKALLAKAGVGPFSTNINFSTSDYEATQLAQIIQGNASSLGITLAGKGMETAVLQDLFNKVAYKGMSLRFSGFSGTDPATLYSIGSYYRLNTNASGFKSDRYTQLVNAAASEAEPARRKQIFSDLNDLLLDEAFVSIIAPQMVSVATRANVQGMYHSMHEALIWTEAWMA